MRGVIVFILFFICYSNSMALLPLEPDEDVILFPVSANVTEQGAWHFTLHHWIFKTEENTLTRKLGSRVIGEMLEFLDFTEEQAHSTIFKQRIKWFLVDNLGWKSLSVKVSEINPLDSVTLNRTQFNGHAYTDVYLALKKEMRARSWIKVEVDTHKGDPRKIYGEVNLIPENGISIISDIDDTIKISDVIHKRQLLKNIFVENYQISKGMPELYERLREYGAYFHYVSASPWQLYPSLSQFILQHYPKGTLMLRHFRIKDSSALKFFQSSTDYKKDKISRIIERYPKHQFILIGDSGERDPEVYASIYRRFSKNIKAIWIREIPGSNISKERFITSFVGIPKSIWQTFNDPGKLKIPQ